MMPKHDASKVYVKYRTFFHVTHEHSVPAIFKWGLDPHACRRLAKRTWLCDLALLPWAIRHVCACHGWLSGEIAVLRVCLPVDLPIRHRSGVYYVNVRIPPGSLGARVSCQY